MAGSSDDQWRRHADKDDELEEGEFVPGPAGYQDQSATDTDEYYNRYSSSESENEATSKTRRYYVATSNGDAICSSSVAENNNGYASSSSAAVAAPPALACRVCRKEFTSSKAVCGHMKVHVQERQKQGNGREKEAKRTVAVARVRGVTGKRGCSSSGSSRSVPPNSEPDNSIAIVAAEPELALQPMPLAFAASTNLSSVPVASAVTEISGEGSSTQPIHNDAMAIEVAGANPPSPSESVVHHQAAPPPPPAGDQAPPVHQQRAAALATGSQNPNGYTCGECGIWFRTHQALGGHVAGHKNRRLAAATAGMHQDGPMSFGGGSEQEKRHPCKLCPAEFARGVQLGGHMRKHWEGEPIVPKKKLRLSLTLAPPPADLAVPQLGPADDNVAHRGFALPFEADVQSPAPAVERAQTAPAPAERPVEAVRPAPEPPATGRVLLFGVDIGPGVQRPRSREGSPATKDSADIGG